ncbi:MAG: hypothetical protein J0I77_05080 [Rudaea sp.]|uniref:hypothetical protein n=1 Tax=unclassified Rudaea TaxID=2627037 RepID=UPI001485289D|nr:MULTISPECIES: hypothetical protein [unclassified Rudaea]MBN8885070.1 hypothetical protein [Rudaea sp.]MBR0344301.1 hypothetical protein [Rudaea sp.]
MDTDIRALLALAQTYFDAAHEMDADKFASVRCLGACAHPRAAERGGKLVATLSSPKRMLAP